MNEDKQQTYTLRMIIDSVVDDLWHGDDHSETTIRCAINDRFDNADKEGYKVNHDYNQKLAVRRVKNALKISPRYRKHNR